MLAHEIERFLHILQQQRIQHTDLNAFLTESLPEGGIRRLAANWNIISSIVYAPLHHMKYGANSSATNRHVNRERAAPGAIGSAQIFQYLLDPHVPPSDLRRVDTAYGQQIVEHRRFIVHSLHEDAMFIICETGFGDTQHPPQHAMWQYCYSVHDHSHSRHLDLPIPRIYWNGRRLPAKQGYWHTSRVMYIPITSPVTWEGWVALESFKCFADAVGTVGPITPRVIMNEYAHQLRLYQERSMRDMKQGEGMTEQGKASSRVRETRHAWTFLQ
jgi:hypothetical protein